jgi:endonuclease/exonuclease/phosphatase family metal-dependent hydrolase
MLIGDFNLIRSPHEKNNPSFDHLSADLFNEKINELALLEIPLFDRLFTWSNKRDTPALTKIDRAFINQVWNLSLPNTSLTSLVRSTSDHVPLKATIQTTIPKPQVFRFENYLLRSPNFLPSVLSA